MRVHLKKSPRFDKKFRVTFENGRTVDFGTKGYSDYTKHGNPIRMRAYVSRHGGFIPYMIRQHKDCLLYTSPSPRDQRGSRMPSSA